MLVTVTHESASRPLHSWTRGQIPQKAFLAISHSTAARSTGLIAMNHIAAGQKRQAPHDDGFN
jgi:hypothetical protein